MTRGSMFNFNSEPPLIGVQALAKEPENIPAGHCEHLLDCAIAEK